MQCHWAVNLKTFKINNMNRAFKTQFHNGEKDEKTIVTMSVTVNNGKRFNSLDNAGKDRLISHLVTFKKQVEAFTAEIILSMGKKAES